MRLWLARKVRVDGPAAGQRLRGCDVQERYREVRAREAAEDKPIVSLNMTPKPPTSSKELLASSVGGHEFTPNEHLTALNYANLV
jgi:hypothetical protein